jgi:hypothetical protein
LAIRIAPSARRHGIDDVRIKYVVEHCPDPIYLSDAMPSDANHVLFLGPDQRGVPLEVLGAELADGDLLVFHAMRLRDRYRDSYLRVMEWHKRR